MSALSRARFGRIVSALLWSAFALLATLGDSAVLAQAFPYLENTPPLIERLTPEVVAAAFPGAVRVEALDDGGPPAAAAYGPDDTLVGYVFSTLDVTRTAGYAGVPFDVVAGVDLSSRVTGAIALFHSEPHLGDPRRAEMLNQFLPRMAGMEARLGATDGPPPSFIAGATISARAMRVAVRDSASIVLGFRSGVPVVTEPTIDTESYLVRTPAELAADGDLATLRITNAGFERALAAAGLAGRTPEKAPQGGPDDLYIELFAGLASPPMIGRNLTGATAHLKLMQDYPEGSWGIAFGSNGSYDFQGFHYNNRSSGYTLDRIRVRQGADTFTFHRDEYIKGLNGVVAPAAFTGIGVLRPGSGFDPFQPFTAELLAYVKTPEGGLEPFVLASLEYTLPAGNILLPPPEPMPAWMEAWRDDWLEVAILGLALAVLTGILVFQARLTRHRRLHRWVRLGFLGFTLVWLGWIAGGQLSILHLLNYIHAPFQNLDWTFYLAEPLIVVLTVYVGISLLILGRGVFCGWLCPFGALQEILATVSRALRLPTWNPPERIQKHLWMGKYVSLFVVVMLTFTLPTAGAVAAEIEPFKTAITSMFARSLPYVIYAAALLGVGLFTERAFCRFLCPLGGALALLDRLHLVNLLKRRPECGSPCHLCERSCPVRAIESNGKIKMAECFQCLDCQVEYYDDKRCPPLAKARKARERIAARGPATVFAHSGRPVTP